MKKEGFTLIELVVAMIIILILAVVALPNYFTYQNQGAARNAENNLISLYNAQRSYFFNNSTYCTGACSIPNSLQLNITDNYFAYSCAVDASGFACSAASPALNITMTVTNTPIVLIGGNNCADYTQAGCNPSCTPNASPYCPT